MILTDRFVYIHYPRTGGTFVTHVLRQVHKKGLGPLARLRGRLFGFGYRNLEKHGTCSEVPASAAGLPLVSNLRNPLDRLVSIYKSEWWKTNPQPWVDWEAIRRDYPSCPDFSFDEFLEVDGTRFHRYRAHGLPAERRLGYQSESFVRFFFRDPERAWRRIDDDYIADRRWERDLLPVRFLRSEALNGDLHALLAGLGYPEERIAFVRDLPRVPSSPQERPRRRHWSTFYTPRTLRAVRRRERLLFAMHPEFDREWRRALQLAEGLGAPA